MITDTRKGIVLAPEAIDNVGRDFFLVFLAHSGNDHAMRNGWWR